MSTPAPHTDTPEVLALTEIFRRAGAAHPEAWARSQVHEGVNQLARFSFLRTISETWLPENATNWIETQRQIPTTADTPPGTPLSSAVRELLTKGVSPEQILSLIRTIQFETLSHVCQTLDGAIEATTPVQHWALFEIDAQGLPTRPIQALHESLLEFDPTGK